MDHVDIIQEILVVAGRLKKAPDLIFKTAQEWAKAERDYRLALSQEETKLRAEGMPSTLIGDIARGNVADLKYQRDLKKGLWSGSIESKKALESQLSGLQSVLRIQNEA